MFLIEISLLLFLISGTELNGKERGTLGGQGTKGDYISIYHNYNLNFAKYSPLPFPLVPPVIGDQGDLDAYISDPALRHPTRKPSAVTKPC